MINRIEAKSKAKGVLHGNLFILGSMAALPLILSILVNLFIPGIPLDLYNYTVGEILNRLFIYSVGMLVVSVLTAVVSYFLVVACLQLRKSNNMEWTEITSHMSAAGFVNYAVKVLITQMMISIGTAFFIIPGLIFSYRYMFVSYIAIEQPELSIKETLSLSNELTNGIKMDLLVLELSFFLWIILEVYTYDLATLYVTPYVHLTKIFIYDERVAIYQDKQNSNIDAEIG